jgi:Integrase core domain
VRPRSTRTIWRILTRHGRIAHRRTPDHHPVERPLPLTSWPLDFKDATTVPVDPDGKRAHSVAVLNTVDAGTSLLLDAQVPEAYTAETSLRAVAQVVQEQGLPDRVTVDRDPRFGGAVQNRDVPAPFVRFWTCLGVDVTVCPPHRPDKNAFVERYHRSYNSECLQGERPCTAEEVRAVTAAYTVHYTQQRPNQALSCGNRPPHVAFPTLPARPPLPLRVDPDAWLQSIDGCSFVRTVQRNGSVTVDDATYYIGLAWVGRSVGFQVDAAAREFVVLHAGQELQRLSLKGLVQHLVTFAAFVDLRAEQARIDRGAHVARTG